MKFEQTAIRNAHSKSTYYSYVSIQQWCLMSTSLLIVCEVDEKSKNAQPKVAAFSSISAILLNLLLVPYNTVACCTEGAVPCLEIFRVALHNLLRWTVFQVDYIQPFHELVLVSVYDIVFLTLFLLVINCCITVNVK